MAARPRFTPLVLCVLLAAPVHAAEQTVTVANYNIQFLDAAKLPQQGGRKQRLQSVISLLEADVIGLQEIKDRAALQQVFDPDEWALIIDDESGSDQDVALAVRKSTLELNGVPDDLDADDGQYLFPSASENSPFPDRRDVLRVELTVRGTGDRFTIMVVHAKARSNNNQPARAATDFRRENAARMLASRIEAEFDETPLVIVGDWNDNPDDRSLNILETGDPGALGGPEEVPGPFLFNLMEPLCAAGHVSHGRTESDVFDGVINTIDPESRLRNNQFRGTNAHTGDILFDQIVVSDELFARLVPDSARVFSAAVAVQGTANTRASDHLPVLAQFVFGGDAPMPQGPAVRIVALLPDPSGPDAGREEVHLKNAAAQEVDLSGWRLVDRGENTFDLSGTIAAMGDRKIVLPAGELPLNNSGDKVTLLDAAGAVVQVVEYVKADVSPGQLIAVP